MNNFLLVTSLFFVLLTSGFSQLVGDSGVSYKYERNPLVWMDNEAHKYAVSVNIAWEEAEKEKKAKYEADLISAEEEYQAALIAYNAKKTGSKLVEKILLDEGAPKKRYVYKPKYKNVPSKPQLASRLKLDGFTAGQDGPIKIEMTVNDFEVQGPTEKKTSKTKEVDGQKVTTTTYRYETTVKQTVHLKVVNAEGEVVYDKIVPSTNKNTTYKTPEQSSQNWYKYKNESYPSFINAKKNDLTSSSINEAKKALNHNFGYSKISRTAALYYGKGKKHEYGNHVDHFKVAKRAYQDLITDRATSIEKLEKCVAFWKEEIEVSDIHDKKARINAKVKGGLLLNIAEAYITMGDYQKAEEFLDEIDMEDEYKNWTKRNAEGLRKFMKDEKLRNPVVEE